MIQNANNNVSIKVNPRDSVPVEQIVANAKENMLLIPKDAWLKKAKLNDEVAWIVSAGPSLDRLLRNGFIRKEWFGPDSKNKLFTIKHALPTLSKYGVCPDFVVALDPRPIDGISTHGKLRKTLYDAAPLSTNMLIASMTHPSVTSWLIRKGYRVFGWHAVANGLKDIVSGPFIAGGTCSATRTISMCHFLGFRKVNLVSFDSNYAEEPQNVDHTDEIEGKKVKKYWKVRIKDSPEFWTSGELIAQIQDIERFLSDEIPDIEINIVGADKGSSLVGALNESLRNRTKELTHYSEIFKN